MSAATVAPPRKTQWRGSADQIAAALSENHGMVSVTARRLGCHRTTVLRHAQRHEAVREALIEAREHVTDTAELALYAAIQRGEAWAVCFYLKTQGKARGYVERQEHTGADGSPIQVEGRMTWADLRALKSANANVDT